MKARTTKAADTAAPAAELKKLLWSRALAPDIPSIKDRLTEARRAIAFVRTLIDGEEITDDPPDAPEIVKDLLGDAYDHVYFVLQALTPEIAEYAAPDGDHEQQLEALTQAQVLAHKLSGRSGGAKL